MTAYRTLSKKARKARSANGFRSMEMVKVFMRGIMPCYNNRVKE